MCLYFTEDDLHVIGLLFSAFRRWVPRRRANLRNWPNGTRRATTQRCRTMSHPRELWREAEERRSTRTQMPPRDPRKYLRIPLSKKNLKRDYMCLNLNTSLSLSHRSAFFIFCSDKRPEVKALYPGAGIGDIAKKLGEMWNNTASEDKLPFEKKASKLKEKYEKVKKLNICLYATTSWISILDENTVVVYCHWVLTM